MEVCAPELDARPRETFCPSRIPRLLLRPRAAPADTALRPLRPPRQERRHPSLPQNLPSPSLRSHRFPDVLLGSARLPRRPSRRRSNLSSRPRRSRSSPRFPPRPSPPTRSKNSSRSPKIPLRMRARNQSRLTHRYQRKTLHEACRLTTMSTRSRGHHELFATRAPFRPHLLLAGHRLIGLRLTRLTRPHTSLLAARAIFARS